MYTLTAWVVSKEGNFNVIVLMILCGIIHTYMYIKFVT